MKTTISPSEVVWTLEEARSLIRILQRQSREHGYHIALGGSVLNRGKSAKDLDLYLLPLNNETTPNPDAAEKWLRHTFEYVQEIGEGYKRASSAYQWRKEFRFDDKKVEVFCIAEQPVVTEKVDEDIPF